MTPHNDFFLDAGPSVPPPPLPPSPVLSDALPSYPPHAAGLDMGEAEPWGAVPPGGAPPAGRRSGTCTAARAARADWRLAGGVTTGAMASTGGAWIPGLARGEARGLPGLLLAPRPAQRVPGRPPTARLAGTWRHRVPPSGLLAGALRPAAHVGVLRRALRHRPRLLPAVAHPRPPRHKA